MIVGFLRKAFQVFVAFAFFLGLFRRSFWQNLFCGRFRRSILGQFFCFIKESETVGL